MLLFVGDAISTDGLKMDYQQFQELCLQACADPEMDADASDEFPCELFGAVDISNISSSTLIELIETGSVTVPVRGKHYILSLNVQEES